MYIYIYITPETVLSHKKVLGQTNLIFRFAGPPAWYFFQIEIKISHTQKKQIFIKS